MMGDNGDIGATGEPGIDGMVGDTVSSALENSAHSDSEHNAVSHRIKIKLYLYWLDSK